MFLQSIVWLQSRLAAERERGATAVEYGMLVALIAAIIVAVVALLGTQIDSAFSKITAKL